MADKIADNKTNLQTFLKDPMYLTFISRLSNNLEKKLTFAPEKKLYSNVRLDNKRREINVGDQIEFTQINNQKEKVLTKVVALYRYRTFKELFFDFPPQYFGGETKEELVEEIEKFYSKDEQDLFGVVGIKIQLI